MESPYVLNLIVWLIYNNLEHYRYNRFSLVTYLIHSCIYASPSLPGICPFVLQPDFKKTQPHLFSYKKSCAEGGGDGTPKEAEAFHSLDGNTHTANTSRTLGHLGANMCLASIHPLHQRSGGLLSSQLAL